MQTMNGRAPVSNDAAEAITASMPYEFETTIEGVAPLLFHAYSVESVKEKAAAAKGSKTKKSDDVESYVYRVSPEDKRLGIPGLVFAAALAHAAKSIQDPRSPRKSAMDLVKASIIPLDDVAPLSPDTEAWDFLDVRRAVVQRNAVPRERPAMRTGWRCTFAMQVTAPDYLPVALVRELIMRAGQFSGLLDFRPTFGRFHLVEFKVRELKI